MGVDGRNKQTFTNNDTTDNITFEKKIEFLSIKIFSIKKSFQNTFHALVEKYGTYTAHIRP
jgi:hypothetical protein